MICACNLEKIDPSVIILESFKILSFTANDQTQINLEIDTAEILTFKLSVNSPSHIKRIDWRIDDTIAISNTKLSFDYKFIKLSQINGTKVDAWVTSTSDSVFKSAIFSIKVYPNLKPSIALDNRTNNGIWKTDVKFINLTTGLRPSDQVEWIIDGSNKKPLESSNPNQAVFRFDADNENKDQNLISILNVTRNGVKISSPSLSFNVIGKEEEISIGIPTNLIKLCPVLVGGDKEFDGHGPNIDFEISLFIAGVNSDQIWYKIKFHLKETTSDWSEANYETSKHFYSIPSSKKLIRIVSKNISNSFEDLDHKVSIFNYSTTFVASKIEILGDTSDNDIGNCTDDDSSMSVYWNPIKVVVKNK